MYIPARHAQTDAAALHGLIAAHPLGLLITTGDEGLSADHIPFELDTERRVLRGHVARANPVWQRLQTGTSVLVVFQAEAQYMSPGWYASKAEHGRVVPTWNYRAVHATGRPRVMSNSTELMGLLNALTDQQEAHEASPWAVTDAPPDYIEKMMRAIVGFEIAIDDLKGRWKLSQSDPDADRAGAIAGLRARPHTAARALADQMQAAAPFLSTTTP